MPDVRRIAIVVFEGLQILDAAGPAEVFSQATRLAARRYDVELVGARRDEHERAGRSAR